MPARKYMKRLSLPQIFELEGFVGGNVKLTLQNLPAVNLSSDTALTLANALRELATREVE